MTDEQGMVTEFTEKPQIPKSDTAFSGVMVAGPALIGTLLTSLPADIGFHVLPQFVNKLYAVPSAEYILDIGNVKEYQQAQREWPGLRSACPG